MLLLIVSDRKIILRIKFNGKINTCIAFSFDKSFARCYQGIPLAMYCLEYVKETKPWVVSESVPLALNVKPRANK